MADTIRARVRRGMLELLEKVDLPEGTEVTVTIEKAMLDRLGNTDQTLVESLQLFPPIPTTQTAERATAESVK